MYMECGEHGSRCQWHSRSPYKKKVSPCLFFSLQNPECPNHDVDSFFDVGLGALFVLRFRGILRIPLGHTLLDAFVEQRFGGQHPFTPAMNTATPGDI